MHVIFCGAPLYLVVAHVHLHQCSLYCVCYRMSEATLAVLWAFVVPDLLSFPDLTALQRPGQLNRDSSLDCSQRLFG